MEKSPVYEELNKHWKAACRIILGGEVGELEEFEGWLDEANEPMEHLKSGISGKEVSFGEREYAAGSKRMGFGEVDFGEKFEPLSINEMKDIDSVIEAVGERAYYCGNILLGNSRFVEHSSNVNDSYYVWQSRFASDSKYAAYSSYLRYCEDVFGVNNDVKSRFLVRGLNTYEDSRCLEVYDTYACADSYFCSRCEDSRDCMFSFNLKGKGYCIGNLQLQKEKYAQIKKKLLSEMREGLAKGKRLPSLVEIAAASRDFAAENRKIFGEIAERAGKEEGNMAPIEKAFGKTTEVVLGKRLEGLHKYEKWLTQHVKKVAYGASAISGRKLVIGQMLPWSLYPQKRIVGIEEGWKAGETLSLGEKEVNGISLAGAKDVIGKIAYFVPETRLRQNYNLIDTALGYNAQHCYKGVIYSNVKYSAFSFWPRESGYIFGSDTVFSSFFCINTYYSNNIMRSFEVDASRECSDAYFCHNCENVQEGMFCFNVKNRKYAIGNAEIGKEEYSKIKKKLLSEMMEEIERTGGLKRDIYNIGRH